MINEVGSEFWNTCPVRQDRVYLLSGRTALEFIIRDILKKHTIKSVLLPSYCCHTMIEPFCRHGINVRFYDVYFDSTFGLSADIPELIKEEVFYCIKYFGFQQLNGSINDRIKNEAEVIIEDQTHSWLTGKTQDGADYSFTSYRKWTGFSGIAEASIYSGYFDELPAGLNNTNYCELRRTAARMKRDYIELGIGDKNSFLAAFNKAEELLETDYIDYLPEPNTVCEFLSFNKRETIHKRRKNASLLLEGLKGTDGIKPLFHELSDSDVPLFIPVWVNDRLALKQHLIDNSIYCPSHWPISVYHSGISRRATDLYEHELSLVCDQRYQEDDMARIVKAIKDFHKR